MAEQRKPGVRGKDKQPRKTDGYKKSCPANLEKARAKSSLTQAQKAELPAGYNSRQITFMQAILPTEPLDYNDVPEMERRFRHYLEMCAEWDMKIGNQAAYAAIGIDKETAWDWANRTLGNPERADFVKKVQQICAMYREALMSDGQVRDAIGIFWQKNYDGMKDQQEVVLTPTNPLGAGQSAEALKQKYLDNAAIEALPEATEEQQDIADGQQGATGPE